MEDIEKLWGGYKNLISDCNKKWEHLEEAIKDYTDSCFVLSQDAKAIDDLLNKEKKTFVVEKHSFRSGYVNAKRKFKSLGKAIRVFTEALEGLENKERLVLSKIVGEEKKTILKSAEYSLGELQVLYREKNLNKEMF